MNPNLQRLHQYPFSRLASLLETIEPADLPAHSLAMGEPQHDVPDFVEKILSQSISLLRRYPPTPGTLSLRQTIANWLTQRFDLTPGSLDATRHVLVNSGSRESLFGIAQCFVNTESVQTRPIVMLPNPGYQIYEGAALMAGAEPYYLPTTPATGFVPDYQAIPEQIWQRTQLLYYCSPGNPIGVFHSQATLEFLIQQAKRYDFLIVADECYSEIYTDEQNPPMGLLKVAQLSGNHDFERCIVMNSLSKRSNLAGLRSGLIAGNAELISTLQQLRSYQGNAMSLAFQAVSEAAWSDEAHVYANRDSYRAKFQLAKQLLTHVPNWSIPAGGFFLWLRIPESYVAQGLDDQDFAQFLYQHYHLKVLPGQYLARDKSGLDKATNPGKNFIRVALVDNMNDIEASLRQLNQGYQS